MRATSERDTSFVLLLRGINVGKGNRLPMAELRSLLESLDLGDVRTVLASGNAVFRARSSSASDLAESIRGAIRKRFDLDLHTHVEPRERFLEIIGDNPLLSMAKDLSRLLVVFGDAAGLRLLAEQEHLLAPRERFSAGKNAAYLHCPNGISDSAFAGAMLGKLGGKLTSRNWNTVTKLAELLHGPPESH